MSSFEEMKSMVDQGVSFGKIAENLNVVIEEKAVKSDSLVERLGLQKPEEKPRSFVEAVQARKHGKMNSPGGAHEL